MTPRTKLDLALGLLIGLAVGVAAAVLRETLDVRVTSPDELPEQFGISALTVVGFDPMAKKQPLVSGEGSKSHRHEAFRRLRTNLQFASVDQPIRSLVVTSSIEGEGKSTSACNLAIAMADAGLDVVLIEGDLRRPKIADYLGLEGAVGLTTVLIGEVPLQAALQPWGTSGRIRVLASGQIPPNPSEVLGSNHMAELIHDLESEALVIIDAPPLLPVTDAAVLSTRVDGALIVVRAKSTKRDQLRQALASLTEIDAHVFGGVYNMAPNKGPDAYGYGQYSYYKRGTEESRGSLEAPVPVQAQMASTEPAMAPEEEPATVPAAAQPAALREFADGDAFSRLARRRPGITEPMETD